MVRDTIVDIQDVHYYRVVVVTWASGWKDHVPFGDMNPYIRSSRWEWVGRECWRVAVYNCGWEFWMTKRRLEMLAYDEIGPIVLTMLHPGSN
ncbi:unnamed protein product [Symbiodinium necroappetens]|uniref:Uncharacterized protein n=2 Tax=Symbiodinium TaxID=2949 RepID=A0A812PJY0_9DINO|nr:hypothetical protein AK812_SmicGene4752 [Symbiodinium microadriaticum]CAE7361276.1 unnamed protein product [Symbiodinium necroappetens]CAE7387697.1 unnamed protein product [Symbiodinium microadriaticum]CAE7505056.1 unnamed protein product [Symbiodinium sp. KB8]